MNNSGRDQNRGKLMLMSLNISSRVYNVKIKYVSHWAKNYPFNAGNYFNEIINRF